MWLDFETILTQRHAEEDERKIFTRSRKDTRKVRLPNLLGAFARDIFVAGFGKRRGKIFLTGFT